MATTLSFKDIIDIPLWRMESPVLATSGAGMALANDMRNDSSRHPYIYLLRSATALDFFDPTTGDWGALASPALAGVFGAGACAVFHPSQGPRGTIAAGASTTRITLTTALPAAVGVNQLANRGDGVGFRVRIIDNVAGGSGKTEEKLVIANTSGTTPALTLDSALSFTPSTAATYEFLSGRVFLLSSGLLAAGAFKYYDVLTNSYSGSLSITNLPATMSTDSTIVALSELYVSNDRAIGAGLVNGSSTYNAATVNCIVATASSGTTITGSGMPSDLQANEYANFQLRIVEDATTPASVGQRRRITSHTGGATSVFTVPTFTTTPSSTAKFVIELDDDKLILRTTAVATTYTYNITSNAWDTTTFAASGSAVGAGCVMALPFGCTRDTTNNFRHSHLTCFRGGGAASVDVLDIATNTWSNAVTYGNSGQTFTTGTCGTYEPATLSGRFLHLNINGTQRFARYDMRNRILDAGAYLRYTQGAALVGGKMATGLFVDGATKLPFVYHLTNTQTIFMSLPVPR